MQKRLKLNVIYNYVGQVYLAIVGILTLPYYLKYLGAEEYGLIAFFTLLQSWMVLFDLGMSPTLGREVAVNNDNNLISKKHILKIVRTLETIFLIVAGTLVLLTFFGSSYIALHWLKIKSLNLGVVSECIIMMGIMLGMRWFISLYKSGVNGYEQQVWVNIINVIVFTLRLPVSLLLFKFYQLSVVGYFLYQLCITIIELFLYASKFYSNIYFDSIWNFFLVPLISKDSLKHILPFMLGTAYTTVVWLFLTQLDKLLLSNFLQLSDFGYFMLVITLVNGISMLAAPVGNALLPRMSNLLSKDKTDEMLDLYHKSTRFISCIVFPVTSILMFHSDKILLVWTRNNEAATWGSHVLPLYALGNGLLALVSFQYYLQYAYGKLKLHIVYNTAALFILVPAIYFIAKYYGGVGTGWIWVCLNCFTLVVWAGVVHRYFAPGNHLKWFLKGILYPFIIAFLMVYVLSDLMMPKTYNVQSNIMFLVKIAFIGSISCATVMLASFPNDFLRVFRNRKL